jgi:hypothetical protein
MPQKAGRERAKILDFDAARKEVCDVIAMTGFCRGWRKKMCHPDSCANAMLWKAVFRMSFDVNCDRVQDLQTRGYFSLSRIMIKVKMLDERPDICWRKREEAESD